jgi:NAD(P)-dependent dehydrogenase (short-subunit alcohol dehydrogenase family)
MRLFSWRFEALSDELLNRQLNTNLLGVIRVTQAFIPFFRPVKKHVYQYYFYVWLAWVSYMFDLFCYKICY